RPPLGGEPDVHGGERREVVGGGGVALRREPRGMAGADQMFTPAVPPELAWEVRADRGDGGHRVTAAEHERTDAAGGHSLALSLSEVLERGDVDPAPIQGFDRPDRGLHTPRLDGPADLAARRPRGQP